MASTRNHPFQFVITAAAVMLFPAGCAPKAVKTPAATATVDAYRATPEADSPAAGICASFAEATIRIAIRAWTDNIPDPRCIKVRADQNLTLHNSAPQAITFQLGKYHAVIEPGASYTIELAFGYYLAPGVHSLHIQPYGGPEIFFDSTKDTKPAPVGKTVGNLRITKSPSLSPRLPMNQCGKRRGYSITKGTKLPVDTESGL
jgi:hypothetical protein